MLCLPFDSEWNRHYFLLRFVYTRIWESNKSLKELISRFWRVNIFWIPWTRKCGFWNLSFRSCVHTWSLLAPEWLEGLCSYSVLKRLCIIGQCSVSVNVLARKMGVFQVDPNTQIGYFEYVSVVYGDHLPKWKHIGGIFRNITVSAWGAEKRNVGFVDFDFTGETEILLFSNQKRVVV
jgi:hypothetical protein